MTRGMKPVPPPPDPAAAAITVERLREAGIHSLLVQFADLNGVAKGKLVPLAQWRTLADPGAGFAGPSIEGTGLPRCGARSEFYARGDVATAQPLPWWPGVARIVASGFVDGQPFDGCPRQVLQRQIERLAAQGLVLQTGIEPEFFLLAPDAHAPADRRDGLDKPSYDLKALPRQAGFLHALAAALEACGFEVLQIDHEDAHGQYELNFRHADALTSADRVMLFKLAAHAIAEAHGARFSMMPKPFADQPGSGLHFHVSLWESGPAGAPSAPTADALLRHFLAGVLAHAPALTAFAAPTVNSYKRLTVGPSRSGTSWAPAYIAHGPNNRTALVRTLPGRFEWRLPDASANPYLATAALIAAGLDGLARRLDPGAAVEDDLFALDLAAIRARGIALLPQTLAQALDALEADGAITEALGATLCGEFVRSKRLEWTDYARHVGDWERARYATLF